MSINTHFFFRNSNICFFFAYISSIIFEFYICYWSLDNILIYISSKCELEYSTAKYLIILLLSFYNIFINMMTLNSFFYLINSKIRLLVKKFFEFSIAFNNFI